jgi:hypothetical protein
LIRCASCSSSDTGYLLSQLLRFGQNVLLDLPVDEQHDDHHEHGHDQDRAEQPACPLAFILIH